METGQGRRRFAEAALMQRVAARLAGSGSAEEGLAGVVPLLSRFLGADIGAFHVQRDNGWTMVGRGAAESFYRVLPRTARLAVRSAFIALPAGSGRPSGARENREASPDSVVVPVRAGRRCLGYGIFRTGAGVAPSQSTLRLLDCLGAQIGAFCENVFRGERAKTDLDRLARANEELAWLLRFSESIHANADVDTMFKWLSRELERLSPVLGVELVSLLRIPVVRIGSVHGNKAPTGGDGRTTAREWSETLASRYRIPVPAAEFKVKRFACLAGPENGRACLHSTAVRTVERSLFHAGRVVGVLAVHVPAGNREDDRRIDGLIASMSGQIGLFLHRSADLEKIRSLANHDTLTGLLNYLSFQEIFDREFERYRRHGRNMSLLLVDLDNFKRINDTLGHQVGDQVLREVSKILQANLRKTDYIFRYGGDEFVILMAETEAERAAVLAQRLREAVKREVRGVTSGEIPVSTSIGIADCSSLTSMEREELLLRADGALYQAKNAGRDRIQVAPGPLACAVGDLEVTASRFFRPAVSGVRLTQGAV